MTDPAPAYDPARLLTGFILLLVAGAIAALSAIVGYQIYTKGEAEVVWVGQLCGLIGWALGQATNIYQNRFGTTKQSQEKDETIKQQARTAAVAQDALLDPNVTVTRSPAAPIKADTVNVDATTANVTEKEKP